MQIKFNIRVVNKKLGTSILREFGVPRDWARTTLDEIRAMLRSYTDDRLFAACKVAVENDGGTFDRLDFELHVADGSITDIEELPKVAVVTQAVTVEALVERQAEQSVEARRAADQVEALHDVRRDQLVTPKTAAPNVNAVAALLAELLATGKAGIDQTEVENIVGSMLIGRDSNMVTTVTAMLNDLRGDMLRRIEEMPPRHIVVKTGRSEVKISGLQHHEFETLLRACDARNPDGNRLNVLLFGPPGTGKTTAARNVAEALGVAFHCNGAVSTKYELTGFIDANGVCHCPEFRKAWQSPSVYLFDEMDGSVSSAIVAFNAALANGVMAFPDGMVERHADCVVIAAVNTLHGATADFTGRTKLDVASLDRFVVLDWKIDEKLEAASAGVHKDWLKEVRKVRKAVESNGIKVLISPRAVIYGASLLDAGLPVEKVRTMVLRKGMNDQQWAMVA